MPAFNIAFDTAYRNLEWLYAAIYIAIAVSAAFGLLVYWWYWRHHRRITATVSEQSGALLATTADQ